MASLSRMQLRLNSLDARVTTDLFMDAGGWRLVLFLDGVRKGYIKRVPNSGRFALWLPGWHWAPEYTPTQLELMVRNYLHNNPIE